MNNNHYIIAIFQPNFTVAAFAAPVKGKWEMEFIDPEAKDRLAWVAEDILNQPLVLSGDVFTGGSHSIVTSSVNPEDESYPEAVLGKLKRAGILSAKIGEGHKAILLRLSNPNISIENREKLVPELLAIPPQDIDGLASLIKEYENTL